MTTLWVLLHVAAQRDYELHSLDFSTAFLQGSLHEEIWLRRPPGFIGSFPAGTQWSLRRPVYGLRQAPREWHDTLRTTLAALRFAPSTADPSLFLHTDATLPPFYVLVYVDDLVFATADTEALAHFKSELQKRHTCTDLGELTSYLGLRITRDRAQRTITLTQSHMVQQVLQRFGFTFSSPQSTPLPTGHSLSAPPSDESQAPKGALGCCEEGVAILGSGSVSWRSTRSSSALSSSCEAEIYAGVMAAQELRWLTYLLTDLGEAPRFPPVLYVDNKAMLALCQEHRLEHRMKHIALRYFLARELQQRGQLRLAYVASQANTADVFTKALQPCDHQPCFAFLDWSSQRDYELHSLDFSTAFLQGNLHEAIWLRRPRGFTGTTLTALGFAPSTCDPSLLLRKDTSLPPFYFLVYVDDLVFATAFTEALVLVKAELHERHTCTDMAPADLAVASSLLSRPVPSPLLSRLVAPAIASPLLSRPSPPAVPSVPPRRAVRPVPSHPGRTSLPVPSHAPRAPCPSAAPLLCPARLSRPRCALPVCHAPAAPCPSVAPCAPCPSVAPPLRPARPTRPVRPARLRLSHPSLPVASCPVASHCLTRPTHAL
ncbi:unnamed protein product [Closterium sp. NIES-53]